MASDNSKFIRYAIVLKKLKDFTPEIINEHVAHLRSLDEKEILEICGPFLDHPGGMVVIKTTSIEDAKNIAETDPFVKNGFESYEIRTWLMACKDNNYLLQ